ncbi:MAG TPA: SDR family oxidoreductase [Planctomycetota bacterium]|nr:SDR family oxidoreductase [Planctomycetota bacterium]
MAADTRVAVVTGGNRGLGLETCRQLARLGYAVLLTSRDEKSGTAAVAELKSQNLNVSYYRLDVTDPASIGALIEHIGKLGRIDALVNNAAVLIDSGKSIFEITTELLEKTMRSNVYGPLELCQRVVPLMRQRNYGRIVNVSSRGGQLSTIANFAPAYCISKTALNAVTGHVALACKGTNVLVNSVCPGWVRTDMGGRDAPRTVEEGADTIVWAATLPDGGPSGGFFADRAPIPW